MMLVLAGNSRNNISWGEKISIALNAKLHHYLHWSGEGEINVEAEVRRIPESDIVVAKSAGVLVILQAIKQNKIHPKICFFLGTPVFWAKEQGYDVEELIGGVEIPLYFVQQRHDPAIPAENLRNIIGKNLLIVIEGNDHKYNNIEEMREIILTSLRRSR